MYINPFVFGVLATVGAEILALIVAAVWMFFRRKKEEEERNDSELKKCPFCGGKAIIVYEILDFNNWSIMCQKCGAYIESLSNKKSDVIEKWNNRVKV